MMKAAPTTNRENVIIGNNAIQTQGSQIVMDKITDPIHPIVIISVQRYMRLEHRLDCCSTGLSITFGMNVQVVLLIGNRRLR